MGRTRLAEEVMRKAKQLGRDDGLAAVRFGGEGACHGVGSGPWVLLRLAHWRLRLLRQNLVTVLTALYTCHT